MLSPHSEAGALSVMYRCIKDSSLFNEDHETGAILFLCSVTACEFVMLKVQGMLSLQFVSVSDSQTVLVECIGRAEVCCL